MIFNIIIELRFIEYFVFEIGMQMMLFMHETDMIMMATNYELNSHEEVVVVSEETEIEVDIEETDDLVLLQDVLSIV